MAGVSDIITDASETNELIGLAADAGVSADDVARSAIRTLLNEYRQAPECPRPGDVDPARPARSRATIALFVSQNGAA